MQTCRSVSESAGLWNGTRGDTSESIVYESTLGNISQNFEEIFFPLYRTVFIYSFIPDPITGSASLLPTPPFTLVSVVDAYIIAFLACLSIHVLGLFFLRAPAVSDLLISNHSHLSIQIYLPLRPSNTIASLCLVDYLRAFDSLFDYPDHRCLCQSHLRISILFTVLHARSAIYSSNSILIFPSFRSYPRIHPTSSNSVFHLDLSC